MEKPNSQAAKKYFQDKISFTAGPVDVNHWLEEKENVTFVDVRRVEDYAQGHVPGAINLPKDTWDSSSVGLKKDNTLVFYCYSQTCHLAAKAAIAFAEKGYSVMEMEGGFQAWKDFQFTVEKQTSGTNGQNNGRNAVQM